MWPTRYSGEHVAGCGKRQEKTVVTVELPEHNTELILCKHIFPALPRVLSARQGTTSSKVQVGRIDPRDRLEPTVSPTIVVAILAAQTAISGASTLTEKWLSFEGRVLI